MAIDSQFRNIYTTLDAVRAKKVKSRYCAKCGCLLSSTKGGKRYCPTCSCVASDERTRAYQQSKRKKKVKV